MRFFELSYGRSRVTVTEHIRSGECNRCGQCRRDRKITFVCCDPLVSGNVEDGGLSTDGRGVWWAAVDGEDRWLFGHVRIGGERKEPCQDFDGRLCKAHGRKHAICHLWPMGPGQVLLGCGYSFTKGETEKL